MAKKKVLLIQSVIPHYRVPIFNKLAESVDLTVVFDSGEVPTGVKFAAKKVETFLFLNKVRIHKQNLLRMAQKYDVTIAMLSTCLTTHLLCRFRRKTRLILWGIGVAASYNVRFDSSSEIAATCMKLIDKSDAALFYSSYPIEKYSAMGVPRKKLFVANNTVQVLPVEERDRNSILFVGSLYKAKKIFELLEGYKSACSMCDMVPKLIIIGDGEDADSVKAWIKENHCEQRILLAGAIYDENVLSEHFSRALMCISPDQAGLSVLKSFGYGVPFVTHKDAITGGERLNIENGVTGILIDSFDEIAMGKNAKKFYDESRTVERMVGGFMEAIEFVSEQ